MAIDNLEWYNKEDFQDIGIHMSFFMDWLLYRDYMSDEMKLDFEEEIQSVLKEESTSVNLIECMDGKLSEHDISEEILPFVLYYYNDSNTEVNFINDFISLKNELDIHQLSDTIIIRQKIIELIDKRLVEWEVNGKID